MTDTAWLEGACCLLASSPWVRVGNKKPTQKKLKKPPKKPTKNVFFGFFGFFKSF
jgi:hypothetical protein